MANEMLEGRVKELTRQIRATPDNLEKEKHLLEMGDLRYINYIATNDHRQLQLAQSCYTAARRFHYR
jgi:hypothetical protein